MIYDFECLVCKKVEERMCKSSETDDQVCSCQGKMVRLGSAPAGLVRGSIWKCPKK